MAPWPRAHAAAREAGSLYAEAAAGDVKGLLLCHLGDPAGGLTANQQAAAVFEELGTGPDEALARDWASWALTELGRHEESLAQTRRANAADSRSRLGLVIPLADLGRIDEAAAILAAEGDADISPFLLRCQGHLAACRGDRTTASTEFIAALDALNTDGDLAEVRCTLRQAARFGLDLDGGAAPREGDPAHTNRIQGDGESAQFTFDDYPPTLRA